MYLNSYLTCIVFYSPLFYHVKRVVSRLRFVKPLLKSYLICCHGELKPAVITVIDTGLRVDTHVYRPRPTDTQKVAYRVS